MASQTRWNKVQSFRVTSLSSNWLVLCLSFIWLIILATQCQGENDSEDTDCLNLLPKDYRKYKVPKSQGKPTDISFRIHILDLDEIDEGKMDFRLHAFILMDWLDERLNIDALPIKNNKCADHVWTPDVIYEAAKKTQSFGKNNLFFEITKDKRIQSVERYAFKIGCRMYFNNYPFDTQHCDFTMALMSNSDKDVHLKWSEDESIPAIQLAREIEPLQFYLRKPTVLADLSTVYKEDSFTTLRVNITLIRRLTGSIVNIYAPSALIVAVSWVTFWLRLEAAPARVAVSMTSLLTLCTQAQQHKSQLPPLNYITAIDIWLFACILMVFSSLVEFAICYNSYMTKKEKGNQDLEPAKSSGIKNKKNSWIEPRSEDADAENKSKTPQQNDRKKCFGWSSEIAGIDVICRKLFPLSFLIFCIVYWVHYLKVYNL